MNTKLAQYRVEPTNFWQGLPMLGVDGYSAMGLAEKRPRCYHYLILLYPS